MADFYALGELLIDFTPAGKTPAGIPIFEQNPGGAPANVAVQAARLGVSAGFIGKVGQDMFGTFLRDTLVKQNVDVENLHFSNDTATSLAFVQLSESGDRDFSFYRNPGADTQITFDEVNKDALANAKVLCFGSLLLTAEPGRTADCFLRPRARCYHRLRPELARTAVAKCRSRHPRHEESAAACRCRQSVR